MKIFSTFILIVCTLQFCRNSVAPSKDLSIKSDSCELRKRQAIQDFESRNFDWDIDVSNTYYFEEILFRRYAIKVSLPEEFGICGLGSTYTADSCAVIYLQTIDSLMTLRFGDDVLTRTQKSADSLHAVYLCRYDTKPLSLPVYIPNNDSIYPDLRRVLRYPERARQETVEGVVYVTIEIDTSGSIEKATVRKGVRSDLDSAAVAGVKQLGKFQPAMRWGIAQPGSVTIPIRFALE